MIYVLSGKEVYELGKKKEELIKKSGAINENVISIDGSARTFSMRPVISQCSTVSLFSDRRVVIVNDPYFLKASGGTAGKPKVSKSSSKQKDDNAAIIAEYCHSPNPDTDLIFYCDGYDADKRTREYKALSEAGNRTVSFISFSQLSPFELQKRMNQEILKRHLVLDSDAQEELFARIGGSSSELFRALDKIDLYGQKKLTLKDIEHLVSSNAEVDIWKLGDSFVSGNRDKTLRTYQEILSTGTQAQAVIPSLAYRLRQLYEVTRCHELGMSTGDITKKTGRFRPENDLIAARGHTSTWFLKLLKELADLDQGIKSGAMNDQSGLDDFLLRNLNG